jgi:hypothetical protein
MDGGIEGAFPAGTTSYSRFAEGLLPFGSHDDDQWGYLDPQARVVIPRVFQHALPFEDGLAVAEAAGKWGVIDRRGTWVIPAQFDHLWPFKKGEQITAFMHNKAWGLVNRAGEVVVQPRYRHASETCHGVTPVSVGAWGDESYGFVDRRGKWIVPPRFDRCATSFSDETIAVAVDNQWGVVNLRGDWILPPKYTSANAFSEGLSLVYVGGERDLDYYLFNGKFGYVNRDDELVIAARFDEAGDFVGGVARVWLLEIIDAVRNKLLEKSGWIDRTGEYLWEPTR